MLVFRRPPRIDAPAVELQAKVKEATEALIKRRRELMENAIRGCVAGGMCNEHHVQIVTQQTCGCEGVWVMPFNVAFWTGVEHDNESQQLRLWSGWASSCRHGHPLPLPPPLAHDTLRVGESFH